MNKRKKARVHVSLTCCRSPLAERVCWGLMGRRKACGPIRACSRFDESPIDGFDRHQAVSALCGPTTGPEDARNPNWGPLKMERRWPQRFRLFLCVESGGGSRRRRASREALQQAAPPLATMMAVACRIHATAHTLRSTRLVPLPPPHEATMDRPDAPLPRSNPSPLPPQAGRGVRRRTQPPIDDPSAGCTPPRPV